jgi:hypothetical protein
MRPLGRRPGIDRAAEAVAEWIPGSRFASPEMTKEQFIKIRHKLATGANCSGKSWAPLNFSFIADGAPFFPGREARLSMPIFKYFTHVGSALLVLLFFSNAYLTDNESLRFDGSLYGSALYAPRVEETQTTAERRFTRDVTPAVRVREVFAVFVPNERRRNKRDS